MSTDNEFGALISIINRAARSYFGRVLKPLGIGPGEQAYILALSPDTALSQDAIAATLSIDKANVARAVASLEKSGYVTREASPDDGRCRLVSLTPAGTEARAAVEKFMRNWVGGLRRGVPSADWEALVTVMRSIAGNSTALVRSPATVSAAADNAVQRSSGSTSVR